MANDGGIHFPPKQRRDKPSFEPPPWERDQFKELATRKQEAEPERAHDEENAVKADTPTVTAGSAGLSLAPPQGETAPGEQEAGPTEAEKPQLDPQQLELLMMGLRSEEPQPQKAYWKISIGSGVIMALIGLVMAVWGFVVLVTADKESVAPAFISGVLLVFGIGFMAAGLWVVFRTLRQQGVL